MHARLKPKCSHQLFPTYEKDYFYTYYYKEQDGSSVSAKGSLFSTSKNLRKVFRVARMIKSESGDDTIDQLMNNEDENSTIQSLTSDSFKDLSSVAVINKWKESFSERHILLLNAKKNKLSLRVYFQSFSCICRPLRIILSESDFEAIIENLLVTKVLNIGSVDSFSSLFSKEWPNWSNKIVEVAKNSKIKSVLQFKAVHNDIINAGTHNNLLALLLLPLIVTVKKSVNSSPTTTENLTKENISNTFIAIADETTNLRGYRSSAPPNNIFIQSS